MNVLFSREQVFCLGMYGKNANFCFIFQPDVCSSLTLLNIEFFDKLFSFKNFYPIVKAEISFRGIFSYHFNRHCPRTPLITTSPNISKLAPSFPSRWFGMRIQIVWQINISSVIYLIQNFSDLKIESFLCVSRSIDGPNFFSLFPNLILPSVEVALCQRPKCPLCHACHGIDMCDSFPFYFCPG